jgi:hypothetical protein
VPFTNSAIDNITTINTSLSDLILFLLTLQDESITGLNPGKFMHHLSPQCSIYHSIDVMRL